MCYVGKDLFTLGALEKHIVELCHEHFIDGAFGPACFADTAIFHVRLGRAPPTEYLLAGGAVNRVYGYRLALAAEEASIEGHGTRLCLTLLQDHVILRHRRRVNSRFEILEQSLHLFTVRSRRGRAPCRECFVEEERNHVV